MSTPWSAPDAGNARPGPVPPPPPAPTGAPGSAPVTEPANPFAPPSDDAQLGPVVPGTVYGQHLPPGAFGAAPQWPTLPGNDPLAVAALVCGIAGFVIAWIFPLPLGPVALGLGIAALVRINRSGDLRRGRGLAIAGIVLGGLGTLGLLAVAALIGAVVWGGW